MEPAEAEIKGAVSQQVFDHDLKHAMLALRRAMTDLITATVGDPTYPQDLARRIGLDKNLAWKIARVVGEPDPRAAAALLPRHGGMRIFIDALRAGGAPPERVAAMTSAVEAFEEMVSVHCGSRETLDIMLAGGGREAGKTLEAHRRLSFRGNSATWGVQARVQVAAHFVAPGDRSGVLDVAVVAGLLDLKRLRPEVPWTVASVVAVNDAGEPREGAAPEPIDPSCGVSGVPLMTPFCTQPLPAVRRAPGSRGVTRVELAGGPAGNTATVSCITGWFQRGAVPGSRSPEDRFGEHYVTLGTPAGVLIADLFVHRSMDYARTPELAVYGLVPGGPQYPSCGRDQGRLPIAESLIPLGEGPPDVIEPQVPRYPELIQFVMNRLGWRSEDFAGFRLKLKYPPLPAMSVMRYELPER